MATRLKRELGIFGAVLLGLGSIVGTGVFVSIGVAALAAGTWVVYAVLLGAVVASFNGLSSAQLAANHPVSGGTYEYGYRYLHPLVGFSAGWLFLLAKSASAATAALGFATYLGFLVGLESYLFKVGVALLVVALMTPLAYTGVRRSSLVNTLILSVTLLSLLMFVLLGAPSALTSSFNAVSGSQPISVQAFLYATALMFVAYTGYGRIATLGEEVRTPRRTIPRAIIAALLVTMTLYASVAFVAANTAPPELLSTLGADLLSVSAESFAGSWLGVVLIVGALTAMLSVLLNLVLGLSRVLLAMARRGDMPELFAQLNAQGTSPQAAVVLMGVVVAVMVLVGNVKTTWSFSAFTVLCYYAITNLAALRLSRAERFFPRWVSVAGLLSCLSLAFFVEARVVMVGLALLALGWLWYTLRRFTA